MSDENIVQFPGETTQDLDPNEILKNTIDENLDRVMVLGWNEDGGLWLSSSFSKVSEMVLLIELCKKVIVESAIEVR